MRIINQSAKSTYQAHLDLDRTLRRTRANLGEFSYSSPHDRLGSGARNFAHLALIRAIPTLSTTCDLALGCGVGIGKFQAAALRTFGTTRPHGSALASVFDALRLATMLALKAAIVGVGFFVVAPVMGVTLGLGAWLRDGDFAVP